MALGRSNPESYTSTLMEEALFQRFPFPMVQGRVVNGVPTVETVNRAFHGQWKGIGHPPFTFAEFVEQLPGPGSAAMVERLLSKPGFVSRVWEVVPGERIVDCTVSRDREGRFVAFLPEYTYEMVVCRLERLRDALNEALQLYDAEALLRELTRVLLDTLGLDWVGVLSWSRQEEGWRLSVSESNASIPEAQDRALPFLERFLHPPEGPSPPVSIGALSVEEGGRWWVRWTEEAGPWTEHFREHGIASLFAGVLITGSSPMVLVTLSGREGALGRVNGDVLRSVWPVLSSTAERHRTIAGLRAVQERDELTGLYSVGGLRRQLAHELNRARRYGYPLSLLALGVANYDEVIEQGGEAIGDEALRRVGHQVSAIVRNVDKAGRLGDCSFLLILPHTPREGAEIVGGRITADVGKMSPLPNLGLDLQAGIVAFRGGEDVPQLDRAMEMLKEAAPEQNA
ncbi:MAG: GGDEF domain-containing protein [Synergistales bacterium]|nr:GGDEF domain-containing protein [Synergistales bacterium]